jgi:hypothetical protein
VKVCQKKKARHWCLTPVILATWKVEIGRIAIGGQSGWGEGEWQIARPHLNQYKLGVVVHTCHLSCAGNIKRKIEVQA